MAENTYALLKAAGFSDNEILAEAGFDQGGQDLSASIKQIGSQAPVVGPLFQLLPEKAFSRAGAMSALKGASRGLSDEVGANVEAGLGVAGDLLAGRQPADRYDQALQGWRDEQRRFAVENPGPANALEITGALLTPGPQKALGLMTDAALYGFGAGEGDVIERGKNALASALLAGGSNALMKGAGKAGKAVSDRVKRFGDAAELSAYGVTQAEAGRAVQKGPGQYEFLTTGEHPTVGAFKTTKDMGITGFGKSADPKVVAKRLEAPLNDLRIDIDNKLKTAQAALKPGEDILPTFTHAQKVVDEAAGARGEALQRVLNSNKKAIEAKVKGDLPSLHKQKIAFNDKTYGANASGDLKKLDAAITRDIKEAIEAKVDSLAKQGRVGADLEGAIKALNAKEGDLLEVRKKIIPEAGKSFAQDLMKTVVPLLRTSGGFGVPAYLGYQEGGIEGALTAGALGAALVSPQGRLAQAAVLRRLAGGMASDPLTAAAGPISRALVAGYN